MHSPSHLYCDNCFEVQLSILVSQEKSIKRQPSPIDRGVADRNVFADDVKEVQNVAG